MTFTRLASFLVALLLSAYATAAPPSPTQRQRAAAAYDAGLQAYRDGDNAVAAQCFLDADDLLRSEDALFNALAAAKASQDRTTIETVAERIVDRKGVSSSLRGAAIVALAGVRGAEYPPPEPEPLVAHRRAEPLSPGTTPARLPEAVTRTKPIVSKEPTRDESASSAARPAFYTGVGVTLVLAGLTTWSGVDTLAAKERLPGTQAEVDSVTARAHRTDALLAGTLVAATATAVIGLAWVDWTSPAQPQVAANVTPDRATLEFRRSF